MFMLPFTPKRTDGIESFVAASTLAAAGQRQARLADPRLADPVADTASAWMNGASLRRLFGDSIFDLIEDVGFGCLNRRDDVFRLQALLHREGDLDLFASGGPTGYWSGREDAALRAFQVRHGLVADGRAAPDGETLRRLRRLYLQD